MASTQRMTVTVHLDDALDVRMNLLARLSHEEGCPWEPTLANVVDCTCTATSMLDDFARLTTALSFVEAPPIEPPSPVKCIRAACANPVRPGPGKVLCNNHANGPRPGRLAYDA